MQRHAKTCWGEDFINRVNDAVDLSVARDVAKRYTLNVSISVAFELKGRVTYLTKPHTMAETQYGLSFLWVS